MLAIVILTYQVPIEDVLKNTDDHRAYLGVLHGRGQLLASGPFLPRTGGALLLKGESLAEVEAFISEDPYFVRGIAKYEVREWAPTYGAEGLEKLTVPAKALS